MPDPLIRQAVKPFLRGEDSVVDLSLAFRAAMNQLVTARPLHGPEVKLFDLLEQWEQAGWAGRPALVDELRAHARSIAADDPA